MNRREGKPGFGSKLASRLAGFATAKPVPVLVVAGALAGLFAIAAFVALKPAAGAESLVPKAAGASRATDAIRIRFGGDAIVVLVEEKLQNLLLTTDVGRLLQLEGCLGGRTPRNVTPYGGPDGPCAAIAKSGSVQAVYGPATFLNEAANQISAAVAPQLQRIQAGIAKGAADARAAALAAGQGKEGADRAAAAATARLQRLALVELARLQSRSGLRGLPSIADTDFVSQIVFDPARGAGTPKQRFSYLFPSEGAALIQVRPRPGLSPQQTRELIGNVQRATGLARFKLKYGGRYQVTGAPVLAESLADYVAGGALPLLIAALIVMAVVLALFFKARLRLLPLPLAAGAGAVVFGAMALLGLPLTVAAVGGLPVLIGLAVDYGVQLQARVAERSARTDGPTGREDAVDVAWVGGPAIITAAAATAAGFLAVLLSPVPMVRGFGLILIAGVAVALVATFTVGPAALTRVTTARWLERVGASLDGAVSGAGEILGGLKPIGWGRSLVARASGSLRSHPGRVLIVAALLAAAGWAVDGRIGVESDIAKLVPSNTPSLEALNALQRETGVAGEVDLLVTGPAVTEPRTLSWLSGVQKGALARWGWSEAKGCTGASLCPGVSLSDLPIGKARTKAQVDANLAAVPAYFRQAVLADGARAGLLAFGVRLLPLSRQQEVFDDLRRRASKPPPGVTASVGGLPVIAAEANGRLAAPGSRLLIAVAALAAVAVVLALALRRLRRVLVPLAATAIAAGWASLALWLLGVELNPLSAALGALVIAIATEFAVLLSERHAAEAEGGLDGEAAVDAALRTTGRAIAISGLTVTAGFAVLVLSDIRMLSAFGVATVVDLSVALAAVAICVPAALRHLARREAGKGDDG